MFELPPGADGAWAQDTGHWLLHAWDGMGHAATAPSHPAWTSASQMKVDTKREELLHIHFNISFPALPCSSLSMDTGDVSGSYHSELGVAVAR